MILWHVAGWMVPLLFWLLAPHEPVLALCNCLNIIISSAISFSRVISYHHLSWQVGGWLTGFSWSIDISPAVFLRYKVAHSTCYHYSDRKLETRIWEEESFILQWLISESGTGGEVIRQVSGTDTVHRDGQDVQTRETETQGEGRETGNSPGR